MYLSQFVTYNYIITILQVYEYDQTSVRRDTASPSGVFELQYSQ